MVEILELIQENAKKLALGHVIIKKRDSGKGLINSFTKNVDFLYEFTQELQRKPASCNQLAENWLLDNISFISEQSFNVQLNLKTPIFRKLPCISTGTTRIESILENYLKDVDGVITEETLTSYLQEYQKISELLIAEIRVISVMLRVVLIKHITKIMVEVRERKQVCHAVDKFVSELNTSELTAEKINISLDKIGKIEPISVVWIVHLISHLREITYSNDQVIKLLSGRFPSQTHINQLISYEHELQTTYQIETGNLITSLRTNERVDFNSFFQKVNVVSRALFRDPTSTYKQLDSESQSQILTEIERIAFERKIPEISVTETILHLSQKEYDLKFKKNSNLSPCQNNDKCQQNFSCNETVDRKLFIAYYLFEKKGQKLLLKKIRSSHRIRRKLVGNFLPTSSLDYLFYLIAFIIIFTGGFFTFLKLDIKTNVYIAIPSFLIALFLAQEWMIVCLHSIIEFFVKPKPLLRYDFANGISPCATTIVAVPVIWDSFEDVERLIHKLEMHYLSCRDTNMYFALLGDFHDAKEQISITDIELVHFAKDKIAELNTRYPNNNNDNYFYLFQRNRQWNESEHVHMGWERKRGKIVEFVELLAGKDDTSFNLDTVLNNDDIVNNVNSSLRKAKYIITLDEDTTLPIGNASRMIATMHLPYNRPHLNKSKTRVVDGYAILQPRVGVSLESSQHSLLSSWWTEPGWDPYAFASSDPYQDSIGQGVFTGKGIFDIAIFNQIISDRIPNNSVLSHDLLEGSLLRTGFLSDIELIDDYPHHFVTFQKRIHRWVRGDWQLFAWLFPKTKNRIGERKKSDLGWIHRLQIIENIRRSLLPLTYYLMILLGATLFQNKYKNWLLLVGLTLLLPLLKQIISIVLGSWKRKCFHKTLMQVIVNFVILPYQCSVMLHAITISLYRQTISKKHLLEWTSSSAIEKKHREKKGSIMIGISGGYFFIFTFLLLDTIYNGTLSPLTISIVLIWGIAPLLIMIWDKKIVDREFKLPRSDELILQNIAKDTWQYYEDFANKINNWLPPDNVQVEPDNGVANRTSPTNIGYLLTSIIAAETFQWISKKTAIKKISLVLNTIDQLEKCHGHLYNWYNTETLQPLTPIYVSSVDSGNYVASLLTTKQALIAMDVKTLDEDVKLLHHNLINRLEAEITNTDFKFLYNQSSKLFHLGFNVSTNKHDDILYDLLASEARQTSFVAIALGQIPISHWSTLGRTTKKFGKYMSLLSWSGTMFEYLMPWQLMKTYKNTIWDSTYRGIVKEQIDYGRSRGVPFGISESGYYAFDFQMNYQYYAFGVPNTGFRNTITDDLVVTPYASVMALPYAPVESLKTLGFMDKIGARGKYGFYESIDYTEKRIPENKSHMIVKSFMAHHQGMVLLTITNFLKKNIMIEYFHNDVRVQGCELLLKERIPAKASIIHTNNYNIDRKLVEKGNNYNYKRRFDLSSGNNDINIHANDRFTSIINTNGVGFIKYDQLAYNRFRYKSTEEKWGVFLYLRDLNTNAVYNLMQQEQNNNSSKPKKGIGVFSLGKSTFTQKIGDLKTTIEICVPPSVNAEFRKIKIKNNGDNLCKIDCTSFLELALANQQSDEAHPAFSKLFIETSMEAECLLAHRRPRSSYENDIWAYHTLYLITDDGKYSSNMNDQATNTFEYETDRTAFIGRNGNTTLPKGLTRALSGSTGAVTDPAFVFRKNIEIKPGETKILVSMTGAAKTKEESLAAVHKHRNHIQLERAFRLAWTRGQIELNHFRISQQELVLFHKMTSIVLFSKSLSEQRKQAIYANELNKTALWSIGISGDQPIVIVRVNNSTNLEMVKTLITWHEYLKKSGINLSFVFLNEVEEESYHQDMEATLKKLIYRGVNETSKNDNNFHLIMKKYISNDVYRLLIATASIMLQSDGASLAHQLNIISATQKRVAEMTENKYISSPIIEPTETLNTFKSKISKNGHTLFFNGIGGFSYSGHEYTCLLSDQNYLHLPWSNVMANPVFGTLTTEKYSGYTWWKNSRECKLTPWSNDPALDIPGEACYIRNEDNGYYWRIGDYIHSPSQVTYGQGYTTYTQRNNNLNQKMTVFVGEHDPVKFVKLKIQNVGSIAIELTLTYYANWVIGSQASGITPMITSFWDENMQTIMAHNKYENSFNDAIVFMSTTNHIESFTGGDFIGKNGNTQNPTSLKNKTLNNETGVFTEPSSALQTRIVLDSKETKDVYFILGCASTKEEINNLVHKFNDPLRCEQELKSVKQFWHTLQSQVYVNTPSQEMNIMLNYWLLYQTLSCRIWARTAFYQSGGAYGFRDQLQDTLALLHHRPDITKKQILLNASHQYTDGDVQHWWHEETKKGIRTKFSDDLHWLPYAVIRYIDHTRDYSILEETAPYLYSEPLQENEHERYEETVQADISGTIYDHCIRALMRGLNFGVHDLPLMGIGDWNDGMSHIGAKGMGESVWLGWFLGHVLHQFLPICKQQQDDIHYTTFKKAVIQLREALNSHAWDGKWYRRAFHDEGFWLGTHTEPECQIDAIAQSWSVLSNLGERDKIDIALSSFEQHLVDRNLNLIRILKPSFKNTKPSPGYIQGYPAGIRENGGQYSHGVIWSIIAYTELKQGNKAFELFDMINPINHTKIKEDVNIYKGEPFVMAADVYTAPPHEGRSGWTWYTGASGWMYQAGIEGILGFKRKGNMLHVNPSIPRDWPGFTVKYQFGQSEYYCIVKNLSKQGHTVKKIIIDGTAVKNNSLIAKIPLIDNKKKYEVIIEI